MPVAPVEVAVDSGSAALIAFQPVIATFKLDSKAFLNCCHLIMTVGAH